jgi:hypothetical protein
MEVNAVETGEEALLYKGGESLTRQLELLPDMSVDEFGDGRIRTGESEVIDLTTQQNFHTFDSGLIDVVFMASSTKAKNRVGKNFVDVGFPQAGSFRVALKSMEDREDLPSIQLDTKFGEVPIIVGSIDANESRDRGSGRVCKSILCIAAVNTIVQSSREGKEDTEDGLLDTRGVGLGKSMELGSSTRGAVAAIPRAASTVGFDAVLPVRADNNSIGRRGLRGTIHLESVELVELFVLGGFPDVPIVEGAKLATHE